ncbi:MAG TPA: hypothetical protein VLY04_06460 [Bryobacteraceae bacterium]|nr:hypothetical protein [Bryobacteraceae bacterium]
MSTLIKSNLKVKPPQPTPSAGDKAVWQTAVPADPGSRYGAPLYVPAWHVCAPKAEDETLETIAQSTPCGTWQELVRYNWGLATTDPHLCEYVNWYLQEYCGCRKVQGSDEEPGPNYVFHPPLGPDETQRILVPVPAFRLQLPALGGRGPKPNTLTVDCPYISPPNCDRVPKPLNCYKRPCDVTHAPPTISLAPQNASRVTSELQQIKSAIITLTQVRISEYNNGTYGLKDRADYKWQRDTLTVDLSTEKRSEKKKEPLFDPPKQSQRALDPSSYLDDESERELQRLADLLGVLEQTGQLQKVIIRGYPDSDERLANGPDDLPLSRAKYIVDRLKSEYGLLKSAAVTVTTVGCTGYYCDEHDHAAAVEIVPQTAPPAAPAPAPPSSSQFVHMYILDTYHGPDLGSGFTNTPPPPGDVDRSQVSLNTPETDKPSYANDPNAVCGVRHDAMSYFDRFIQVLYPDEESFARGDEALRSNARVQKIYDWIQSLRLVGQPGNFPPLSDKYKWKSVQDKIRENGSADKHIEVPGADYTLEEVACVSISAMFDSATLSTRISQARTAVDRWLYSTLCFKPNCPPQDWKPAG